MGGDESRRIGVTLLLAGLVFASTVTVPAGARSCPVDTGYQLERGDGAWIVGGGDSLQRHESGQPWHDSDELNVSWPEGDYDEPEHTPDAFARGPNDDWWVFVDHGFARLGENWSKLDRYPLTGNHTGLTATDGSLWTVGFEGAVTRFDVRAKGPVEVVSREHAVGRAVRDVEDLHRGPEGAWWVLSRGGGIAEYTPTWEHTGYRHGDTLNLPDCNGGNPDSAEWFVVVHLAIVGGGVLGTFRTRAGTRVRLNRVALGIVSLAVADVLFNYRYPTLLSELYRLADVAVSVPLVSTALLVSSVPVLFWDDRTVTDAMLLFALTSPLFFAGLLY
jgi:hypothetical protein